MVDGGLMCLVAYGAQDVYLIGNPQIIFFRAAHTRNKNSKIYYGSIYPFKTGYFEYLVLFKTEYSKYDTIDGIVNIDTNNINFDLIDYNKINDYIYKKSSLFNELIESNDDDDEIKNIFKQMFLTMKMTIEEIDLLTNSMNFKNIIYTEDNIYKYVDFIYYFGFDIINEFTDFIIYKYIFNFKLLNKLKKHGFFCERLLHKLENPNAINANIIYYISQHIEITNLYYGINEPIEIPSSVQNIIFSDYYNQETKLHKNITNASFGNNFKYITYIPKTIQCLKYNGEIIKKNKKTPHPIFKFKLNYYFSETSSNNCTENIDDKDLKNKMIREQQSKKRNYQNTNKKINTQIKSKRIFQPR